MAPRSAEETSAAEQERRQRQQRAGLVFHLPRIEKRMIALKGQGVTRISEDGIVALTAIIEHVTSVYFKDIKATFDKNDNKRINLTDVLSAIRNNGNLDRAFAGTTVLAADRLSADEIAETMMTGAKAEEHKKNRILHRAKMAKMTKLMRERQTAA